jgi:hypothetical protein
MLGPFVSIRLSVKMFAAKLECSIILATQSCRYLQTPVLKSNTYDEIIYCVV